MDCAQVHVAGRYYAEFADEIDAELAHNDEVAEREMAAWERERQLLSG